MEEELQRSLLSAVGRMTEVLGRAEGSARRGELHQAMVFLATLEWDARESAEALAASTPAMGPVSSLPRDQISKDI